MNVANLLTYFIHHYTVSPDITVPVEGETLTIIEGGNITCTATGYPVPDIVWLYINGSEVDKKRLVTSSVMATGVGNVSVVNVLMIEVMRRDSGVYTCLATNPVGDDNTTVNVRIHCKCNLSWYSYKTKDVCLIPSDV